VQSGFTLIEIAIVLFIVVLLTAGVVTVASTLIQSGRTQDAMKMAADLAGVTQEFRQKYHFLPGDFPINGSSTAVAEIPGVAAICLAGGANAGNGDGLIQAVESACVPEHLSKAGYVKGTVNPATGLVGLSTFYGPVQVIGNAASGVAAGTNPLPATVRNVIEYANLPCDVALEMDRKLDDGNLATGKVRASVALCTPSTLNDPVPFFALSL
jgi:prepilin-type N-terminal cleavage/methylation domain-containing protein